MIDGIKSWLTRPVVRHLLFWLVVSLYFIFSANMQYYSGYVQVIEFNAMVLFIQIIVAYVTIYVLVPGL
ncbi:MAG: hypothetical protein AAFO69_16550, partial [Bacteroidota bacterium]